MSNEALLIIDYTNDFIATNGTLTVGTKGQKLEKYIQELATSFVDSNRLVIIPTDLHIKNNPYHPETQTFPPHNLDNTWGRQFFGLLKTWYDKNKTKNNVIVIDKTRYSAFVGTNLDLLLRERHVDTIHLVGVCTDICILHTAISAYNLNYNIVIHKQGVAGLTSEGQSFALNHCKDILNAKIV
jgi:nicotinamidase-related amidase